MVRFFRAAWPLLGLLFLAVFFAFGLSRDPSLLPSEIIDRPVPIFELGDLYQPDVIHTQDMFLGRISLVNVFGSWCISCGVEHPKLMELAEDEVINLVGIDWRDTREKGQRWLRKNGDPYDQVIFDGESRLAIELGVTGAPETFLIDEVGRIRYKHTGIITDDVWSKILRPLIAELEVEE